jgi:potassium-transporting ATPase ATP-binding subunit
MTSTAPVSDSTTTTTTPSTVAHGVSGQSGLFDKEILWTSLAGSFKKLDPRVQIKNPVMFVVLVGSVVTLLESIDHNTLFDWSITIWLFVTVLFANFAEAMAEGRGKAQADTLRKMRSETEARRLRPDGTEELVAAAELAKGDMVVCEAGDLIPSDGEITEGVASVDESAITGESAPVIRESGGDRSAVTGGTKVLSDRIVVRITAERGHTFLDRMISLVEGANRQKTPNEIALTILLAVLTIIFIPVVVVLTPFGSYIGHGEVPVVILVSLLVCLIPTTIGALLSAIGIAGMDRLVQRNVLAVSGRAVEAAGDVQTLLLDKTGTITLGNRMASDFFPAPGHDERDVAEAAQLASLADETPEGRSIVVLAKERFDIRERQLTGEHAFVPFSATTRMSGLDLDGRQIRKGAAEAVERWAVEQGGAIPTGLDDMVNQIARQGSTPLVVAEGSEILGIIELKDVVKTGIQERFAEMRAAGIRTVMVTGDNPLTAAAIAQEAGVDDFLAEATPETKMELIRSEQEGGRLVAMTGDGTNDAPALAQADVGVAMNTGTTAAKEAGNMVDLDSNPTKLIDIVEIGKQLLITRGSLTTFSIANDVAKYFAIIPALFVAAYPQLETLNIMKLHSPQSAVLSAVIFNALVIVALIPLALRGVRWRPSGATSILRRNVLIYGVGGIIVPFIFIKLIDLFLTAVHWY